MSYKHKLFELAKTDSDLMVAIVDAETFHFMVVDKKLRVTDPEAYKTQHENLAKIREEYTEIITNAINEDVDTLEWVVKNTLIDIAGATRGYPIHNLSADYIRSQ